jgi:hypothetical protein
MAVFWHFVSRTVIDTDRRFRVIASIIIALIIAEVSTSETSQHGSTFQKATIFIIFALRDTSKNREISAASEMP